MTLTSRKYLPNSARAISVILLQRYPLEFSDVVSIPLDFPFHSLVALPHLCTDLFIACAHLGAELREALAHFLAHGIKLTAHLSAELVELRRQARQLAGHKDAINLAPPLLVLLQKVRQLFYGLDNRHR